MSTVLFTWELGVGLGHMSCIRPLAREMHRRGDRVVVSLQNFAHANKIFSDFEVSYVSSPTRFGSMPGMIEKPSTVAHMLNNIGFGAPEELSALVCCWLQLFDLIQPDLIVADHSPTVVLASRARGIPVATMGTGFDCPLPRTPFSELRPPANRSSQELLAFERSIVDNANQVLSLIHI